MFGRTEIAELSKSELEHELRAQAAHVDAGLCRLLELEAECERRLDWTGQGTTFAAWLAWRCSLLPRQAREHEPVAQRLHELPLIHAAFARGELSFGKVSTLVRIAVPENEEQLIELAEVMTASQLERAVSAYRRVTREEAAEQQEQAFLHWFWTEDGSLSLRGLLSAEDGALVVESLEAARAAIRERSSEAAGEQAGPPTAPVSNVDALVAIADLALAGPRVERSGGDRHQVVVHVDAQTLAAGDDGLCELADGPPLAAETARRLSCDASVVELTERDGRALSLGRKRRTVSPALRRALGARDRCCRFPGCDRTRFVDAHHVRHWSEGGETNLDNLVLLCRRHHRLVHEHGYSVKVGGDGRVEFRDQSGFAMPTVPRSPPSNGDALRNAHRRLAIDHKTCRNGTGDRIDLGNAVDGLLSLVN
ncbi:MAG TPA: DUF222 domain-containing protein [Gaiellaceae bacterium]